MEIAAGHKTGHYLDQRDNRTLVRGIASGRDVLDVFASTGGFALAAVVCVLILVLLKFLATIGS